MLCSRSRPKLWSRTLLSSSSPMLRSADKVETVQDALELSIVLTESRRWIGNVGRPVVASSPRRRGERRWLCWVGQVELLFAPELFPAVPAWPEALQKDCCWMEPGSRPPHEVVAVVGVLDFGAAGGRAPDAMPSVMSAFGSAPMDQPVRRALGRE